MDMHTSEHVIDHTPTDLIGTRQLARSFSKRSTGSDYEMVSDYDECCLHFYTLDRECQPGMHQVVSKHDLEQCR